MGSDRKKSTSSDGSDGGRMASCMASINSSWHSFLLFLYNPEEKTVFGRGAKSWGQILVFYTLYYAFLAGLFALSISIVLSNLDPYVPSFQTRIQAPGISIQPRQESMISLTTDVKFDQGDKESYKLYTDSITSFLKGYANQSNPTFYQNCSKNSSMKLNQEFADDEISKVCVVNTTELDRCAVYPYGYDKGQPCIYVKVNRIVNWFPVSYNNLDEADGNEDSRAPPLKSVLKANKRNYNPHLMYVACYGSNEENQDLLNGVAGVSASTKYFPPGIEFKYYPYYGMKRMPQYKSPMVAVQFTNVTRNKEVKVRCKAYSRNIVDDERMDVGYMQFILKVDKKEKE